MKHESTIHTLILHLQSEKCLEHLPRQLKVARQMNVQKGKHQHLDIHNYDSFTQYTFNNFFLLFNKAIVIF